VSPSHRSIVLDALAIVLLVSVVALAVVKVIIAVASRYAVRVDRAMVVAFVEILETKRSRLVVVIDTGAVVKANIAVASRNAIRVLWAVVVVGACNSTTNRRMVYCILGTGRCHCRDERQERHKGDAQIKKVHHCTFIAVFLDTRDPFDGLWEDDALEGQSGPALRIARDSSCPRTPIHKWLFSPGLTKTQQTVDAFLERP
jgi:hypothetical protein